MRRFITLTASNAMEGSGRKICVRADLVGAAVIGEDGYTAAELDFSRCNLATLWVKESPEEVRRLVEEAEQDDV